MTKAKWKAYLVFERIKLIATFFGIECKMKDREEKMFRIKHMIDIMNRQKKSNETLKCAQ